MYSTTLVLLSDQVALQRSVDVVANNIANSSTTGYKREALQFGTLVKGARQGNNINFVYDRATYRDTSTGVISATGNPLDLAIQGPGYFQVQTAQGTQYTRDGVFRTDNQGQIVTTAGQPVLSDAGSPIILPEGYTDVTISGDGFITAQVGTSSTRAQLGKIGVVQFADDQQMNPVGNNLLTTTQTPTPVLGNAIVQGAVEQSNVNSISEITNLITMQRAYEQATNLISQENARRSDAIDKLSATS